MKRTLVITDLTQMPNRDEVCVVGVDENGNTIRPVCASGFNKSLLIQNNTVIIRPGSKVEFDLHDTTIRAPHIEDKLFDPSSITHKGFCTPADFEKVLIQTSNFSVDGIYDGKLNGYDWISADSDTKSIATLSGVKITEIEFLGNNFKPWLTFIDKTNCEYYRSVSDLTFWNFSYYNLKKKNAGISELSEKLISSWRNSRSLYLRIGLARPWKEDKCWLQVTGIYSFPDYLDGKTFDDFS